jgi:hypothetical protein
MMGQSIVVGVQSLDFSLFLNVEIKGYARTFRSSQSVISSIYVVKDTFAIEAQQLLSIHHQNHHCDPDYQIVFHFQVVRTHHLPLY